MAICKQNDEHFLNNWKDSSKLEIKAHLVLLWIKRLDLESGS